MPFQIIRQDITKMKVDAIVNATDVELSGEGGVDQAIHDAAGPQLLEDCKALNGCNIGEAKITAAYHLPCRYVIHTVGPVWKGGMSKEAEQLRSCYQASLQLAVENECKSVAIPLISSGTFGYPKQQALEIAEKAIRDSLSKYDIMVYLVVYDSKAVLIAQDKYLEIQQYIDDTYVEENIVFRSTRFLEKLGNKRSKKCDQEFVCDTCMESSVPNSLSEPNELSQMINQMDESFSQMLMRMIDERGYKDSEIYTKANIDRKLFSKIRCNSNYKPKKQTILSFAIALELNLDETQTMLSKAGYILSDSIKFDVIIKYFITHKKYNIMEINETLFDFDQMLLCN